MTVKSVFTLASEPAVPDPFHNINADEWEEHQRYWQLIECIQSHVISNLHLEERQTQGFWSNAAQSYADKHGKLAQKPALEIPLWIGTSSPGMAWLVYPWQECHHSQRTGKQIHYCFLRLIILTVTYVSLAFYWIGGKLWMNSLGWQSSPSKYA